MPSVRKSWFCCSVCGPSPVFLKELVRMPCQKRVIFSCRGRSVYAMRWSHQRWRWLSLPSRSRSCSARRASSAVSSTDSKSTRWSIVACNPMPRKRASSACEAPNPARHSRWLTRASSLASRGGGVGVAVGVGKGAGVGVGGTGAAVGVAKGVTAASRNGVGVGKGAVVGVDAGAVGVASIRAQAARKAGMAVAVSPRAAALAINCRRSMPSVRTRSWAEAVCSGGSGSSLMSDSCFSSRRPA